LLLAGSFAATGRLPLGWLLITVVLAAFLGDNAGYEIGKRTGKRIFKKPESLLFNPEHLLRAETFYQQHGGKTVMLARFIPMVRTFAPLIAGVGNMNRKRFMFYNFLGALIWGVGVTMIGYLAASLIGDRVEELEKYLLLAVGFSTVAAFGPVLIHYFRAKRSHNEKIRLNKELDAASKNVETDIQK
jgi:membrane-associated protein